MAIDRVEQTVVTSGPTEATAPSGYAAARPHTRSCAPIAAGSPWPVPVGSEMGRRIVVLVFGVIQLIIGARFVLLLLDAREANGLVSGILNLSQLFVAPFEGILRTDALQASSSIFDVTAVVAIVGWTILELIVIWALGIFRRQPA